MSNGRVKFGASVFDVLWIAQEGRCWIAGCQMHRKGSNHPRSASKDHVFPKGRFGDHGDIGLTLLACRQCNSDRGSPPPTDDDIRALVRIWRLVDRRWLNWSVRMLEGDVTRLRSMQVRYEIMRMVAA